MPRSDRKVLEPEVTTDEVIKALEYDILFGEFRPRERLVEHDLIQRFNTKRHVVRHALAELERMGTVVRIPNRGATVRDFTSQEVEEIAEIRETLQRRAAERIKLPAADQLLRTLENLQQKHDEAVESRDPRKIDEANEAFHSQFFDACGNQHLAGDIARYAYLSRAMRLYPMVDSELLETLRQEHWAMIQALKTGDRQSLVQLVVDHIQHSKKIYLDVRKSLRQDAWKG